MWCILIKKKELKCPGYLSISLKSGFLSLPLSFSLSFSETSNGLPYERGVNNNVSKYLSNNFSARIYFLQKN